MEYSYYRSLVLMKTNGRNVHDINGALGGILNNTRLYWDWERLVKDGKATEEEKIEYQTKAIERMEKEILFINKETGIGVDIINFLKANKPNER